MLRLQQLRHLGSVVVARGVWSVGSVTAAHGLSCPKACGIVLHQRLNLCPLHWPVGSLPLSHQGSPVLNFFLTCFLVLVSNKGRKVHINLVETYSFIQY